MAVKCTADGRALTVSIVGELDHHRAKGIMEEMSEEIDRTLPQSLTLDLTQLSFTDSSGIAVLLRAKRRVSQAGGTMVVQGTPKQAEKVFSAAGLQKLIRFE